MARQAVTLQPMEDDGGADTHLQPVEDPGGCVLKEAAACGEPMEQISWQELQIWRGTQVKDVDILHSCAANTDEQEWPVVIRTSDVEYTLQRTLG
ncbi:AN1-type zinc finger protein 5-like [Grus japonensis]|uniref:AN1-type zinc finger protein 5-like n=1 Tax=Grus japonensis TaxID=30415 RepID=A0ABC9VS04_GRUJA